MKIENKKNTKLRYAILAIIIALLLALAGVWYFVKHNPKDSSVDPVSSSTPRPEENKVDYSPARESDNIAEGDAKEQLANGDNENSSNDSLAVTITSVQQQDKTILIRTLVDGTTSGTCTMTASKAGSTSITRTAPVGAQASYALCQGFNVASSDFPDSGTWTIQVALTTDKGSANSKTTTIEVRK